MLSPRRLAEELGLAFALLTRLPVPRFEIVTGASVATAFWAYPLAGAAVSAVSALGMAVCWSLTGEPLLSALAGLAVGFLASGGFHEDGLADFWDGIGGGAEPERRLEIMRDSRLGTYGALALFVALAAKLLTLGALLERTGLGGAVVAMLGCGALSRAAIALPFATLRPARDVGLAAQATRPAGAVFLAGIAVALVVAAVLLGLAAGAALLGAAAGAGAVTLVARRHLGGFTGDVLGAAALTAEILALVAVLVVS